MLLPCDSIYYQESTKFTNLQSEKNIGLKNIKVGYIYQTNQLENWLYLGKHDFFINKRYNENINYHLKYNSEDYSLIKNSHIFISEKTLNTKKFQYHLTDSVPSFKLKTELYECSNYNEIFNEFLLSKNGSDIKEERYIKISDEIYNNILNSNSEYYVKTIGGYSKTLTSYYKSLHIHNVDESYWYNRDNNKVSKEELQSDYLICEIEYKNNNKTLKIK